MIMANKTRVMRDNGKDADKENWDDLKDTPRITSEEALKAIQKERAERTNRFRAKLIKLMEEERCRISPVVVSRGGQIQSDLEVIPVE